MSPSIVGQAEFDALVAAVQPSDGELIEVKRKLAPPNGIDWARLPEQALEEMPVLGELKRLLASRRAARRKRKARP
jgi:hypothetical protein